MFLPMLHRAVSKFLQSVLGQSLLGSKSHTQGCGLPSASQKPKGPDSLTAHPFTPTLTSLDAELLSFSQLRERAGE